MKLKSIVTAIVVAGTFGAGAATVTESGKSHFSKSQLTQSTYDKKLPGNQVTRFGSINKTAQTEYFNINRHDGEKLYIVRLIDSSTASYSGGVKGLDAVNKTAQKSKLNNETFNAKSKVAVDYNAYLDRKQDSFVSKAKVVLGANVQKLQSFKYGINGILTKLTFNQAQKLSSMPEVAFIEQDTITPLNTDTGPGLIGAGGVWDGTAAGSEYLGEGVIIGILDTGVNTDHRSFAATGDDGFTVANPMGDDVYLGDCVSDATLCNSKLIGVYSYSTLTDAYADAIFAGDTRPANGEDYNGHGSHTASTSGGNVLDDVPFVVSDFLAGTVGDGIETSYIYPRMSGVAPHANIVSFQVCLPGNNGDTYSGCLGSATLASIDDAIAEGVDVLNYSIGGTTPFSPWTSSIEIAFLSAQAAGIYVAVSAGNSGPGAYTTTKAAPWYTSVAATQHGLRNVVGDGISIGTFTGGDTAVPADIVGAGLNGDFTGDIVWAGDFTNSNDPDGDPAQCLQPFPAGTFLATQIVLCDRGAIARVSKAANAASGGAGGFVLANLQGGADSLPGDFYAVPGIHISADDGDMVKTWIASGTGHVATISDASLVRGTNVADEMAGFSSRGPNEFAQLVTPQVAAPGVSIYAAYSDEQPFNDVTGPAPSDFISISGTSMASPHVAGSAALLKQAQPTWNPDQIRSALMMTATTAVTKNDDGTGSVDADLWDIGAGRIQVDLALNSGLVMSESQANYLAADPALGGDTRTLNVPSLANFACGGVCTWTRTFTAVVDGTYTIATSSEALTAAPASIEAVAGTDYSVVFSFDVSTTSTGVEQIEQVDITSPSSPDLHLPVYIKVNNGAVPSSVDIKAGRDSGSYFVSGVQSIATDNLVVTFNGLFDPNASGVVLNETFDIAVDPTNGVYNDDLTQVYVLEFDVSPSSAALNVSILNSTSTDNDLFVEWDPDLDGNWKIVDQAATGAADESLSVAAPPAGRYRAIVQNWASTSGLATDTGDLTVEVVPITDPLPGMTIEAPTTADGVSPLDVRLTWDLPMELGVMLTADVTVMAGETLIGNFPVTITRVADDVNMSSSTEGPVNRGDIVDYTIVVNRNIYNDVVGYEVDANLPEGTSIVPGSLVVSGGNGTVKDPNAVGLSLEETFDIAIDPTNGVYNDNLDQVYVLEFEVPTATVSMAVAISNSTSTDNDLFIEWDPAGDGNWKLLVQAATAAADETASLAAPAAGMYRIIVQNWGSSSGLATDTGTLSVDLTPAKGEGFLWNASSALSFDSFSVVSSADDDLCAAAGFGGYLALEAFGIGTQGITGDTVTFSAFAGTNFPFYGKNNDGISFTDDGFALFSGTTGPNPWVNTSLPNSAEPNDMVAAFWKDLEIFDDGTRGIRLATAGPTVAIIEFDEIGSWADDTDRFSFQIVAVTDATDDPGSYEYIVAYSDTQVGDFTGATSGVENADGSVGTDGSSLIQPGVQLCYDAIKGGDSFTIDFSLQTSAATVGNPISPSVTVSVDLPGAKDVSLAAANVPLVNVAPVANAGTDLTIDRSSNAEITLDGAGTVDLDEDQLVFAWTTAESAISLHGTATPRAFFSASDVPNGTYTFNLTVSDSEFSSSDSVTVTVEGSESGGGSGAMAYLLMLLALPVYFRRRNSLKK